MLIQSTLAGNVMGSMSSTTAKPKESIYDYHDVIPYSICTQVCDGPFSKLKGRMAPSKGAHWGSLHIQIMRPFHWNQGNSYVQGEISKRHFDKSDY